MDTPLTLTFQVKELNRPSTLESIGETYSINVTREHTIGDIKNLIWLRSENYGLKPFFLSILYQGKKFNDDIKVGTILGDDNLVGLQTNGGHIEAGTGPLIETVQPTNFLLQIDYTLYFSKAIPSREPIEEVFDISLFWNDADRGYQCQLKTTLACTKEQLKHRLMLERGEDFPNFDLVLRSNQPSNPLPDAATISIIISLDVPPKSRVLFDVVDEVIPQAPEVIVPGPRRFLVKVQSTVASLEKEAALFEANASTTFGEFKRQVIARKDQFSVTRTFPEQVLFYEGERLVSRDDLQLIKDALNLDDHFFSHRRIAFLKLVVTEGLNGDDGILSREFFRNVTGRLNPQNADNGNLNILVNDQLSIALENEDSIENENLNISLQRDQNGLQHDQNGLQRDQNGLQGGQNGLNLSLQDDENDLLPSYPIQQGIIPVQLPTVTSDENIDFYLTGQEFQGIHVVPEHEWMLQEGDPRELVADISSPTLYEYEFTLEIEGEVKSVLLNTTECIVVDNGSHQPYVLVSRNGLPKLGNVFRQNNSLMIQKVRVLPAPEEARPQAGIRGADSAVAENADIPVPTADAARAAPVEAANIVPELPAPAAEARGGRWQLFRFILTSMRRLADTRIFLRLLQFFLFFSIMGGNLPSAIIKPFLIISCVVAILYTVFYAGEKAADAIENNLPAGQEWYLRLLRQTASLLRYTHGTRRLVFHGIKKELVILCVTRKRDYEYILRPASDPYWWFVVEDTFDNFWKDALSSILTVIPSFQIMFLEEFGNWRDGEVEALKSRVKLYCELIDAMVVEYDSKFTPSFIMPSNAIEYSEIKNFLDSNEVEMFVSMDQMEGPLTINRVLEIKYKLMIDCYKNMETIYDILNKSIVTNEAYSEGHMAGAGQVPGAGEVEEPRDEEPRDEEPRDIPVFVEPQDIPEVEEPLDIPDVEEIPQHDGTTGARVHREY
jgi:hypothetical protein